MIAAGGAAPPALSWVSELQTAPPSALLIHALLHVPFGGGPRGSCPALANVASIAVKGLSGWSSRPAASQAGSTTDALVAPRASPTPTGPVLNTAMIA